MKATNPTKEADTMKRKEYNLINKSCEFVSTTYPLRAKWYDHGLRTLVAHNSTDAANIMEQIESSEAVQYYLSWTDSEGVPQFADYENSNATF
jgi:uncharacterized protein YcfL